MSPSRSRPRSVAVRDFWLTPSTRSSSCPGFYEITGLAWSGRGRINKAEVSTDGGKSWQDAQLNEPILPKAVTRFRFPWWWDGKGTSLQSRCTDETDYLQPTREELLTVRGWNATDHYNGIKVWYVHKDGKVSHE
jgi:sulfane dehydrogenase subunit SoxC